MDKRGGVGIIVLVLVVIVALGVGAYFMFGSKCPKGELFNPYEEICVSESILCNLGYSCMVLAGQTVSFNGGDLKFSLVSADEGYLNSLGYDRATINVEGQGEAKLDSDKNSEFLFGDYKILFVSSDGDQDKLMGAKFITSKV